MAQANDDTVSALGGLRPVCQPYGTIKRSYYKLTTSTLAMFIGDAVDLDTNGQATAANALASTGIGIRLLGAVVGFSRDSRGKMGLPDAMSLITAGAYLPGNTDAYVCVADDPNQEFVIQEADSGTALTSANIGNSAGIGYTTRATSGSLVTGSSWAEIIPHMVSATSEGPLQIVGLADNMNSDGSYNTYGDYAKWRVRIRLHRLASNLVGTNVI